MKPSEAESHSPLHRVLWDHYIWNRYLTRYREPVAVDSELRQRFGQWQAASAYLIAHYDTPYVTALRERWGRGSVWGRMLEQLSQPDNDTFDASDLILAAQYLYDLAEVLEEGL